ncbi:MAG TPA: beta-galactosidase domain 4-containing protein, partial [Pyrinomonadaceae bacterium]|nr:beta-galactosidase domain 4-containing protein [Pyrinomonadaceae bacterium]
GRVPALDVPAGESREVTLGVRRPRLKPGAEYFLKVTFSLAADARWAPRGHVVAWDQYLMPYEVPPAPARNVNALPALKLTESEEGFTVKGARFTLRFGRRSGALESYEFDGRRLLAGPLAPNFWRAPTDNDRGNRMPQVLAVWRDAGARRSVEGVASEQLSPQAVRVTARSTLPAGSSEYRNVYTVYGDGSVEVESSLAPGAGLPDLPRFGLQLQIPGELGAVEWYGRGPHENYWDRNTGAAVGLHALPVESLFVPYIEPQENGNRTDVRWVTFTNRAGFGLRARGLPLLYFSAWRFRPEELETRKHSFEIVPSDDITVNLDYRQMGVGGDNSWGAWPHREYRLAAKPYSYKFRLEPVGSP